MSEANQKTLATYNNGVENYVNGTPQFTDGFQKKWLDSVFSDVPKDASILELGSAFGRDARYLKDLGYDLELTDASESFVSYLNKHDFNASVLDIVSDRPQKQYDVVLACAVFLHFTDEDFRKALANVESALLPGGKFVFSLKIGDGEAWSQEKMNAPRYFNYWREAGVEHELKRVGMELVDAQDSDDKWLLLTAMRSEDGR